MLVPVMLLRTGCETAARELQGRLGHFPKMRLLFTQRLVRAYVSFELLGCREARANHIQPIFRVPEYSEYRWRLGSVLAFR
jgi:hypothetical protein